MKNKRYPLFLIPLFISFLAPIRAQDIIPPTDTEPPADSGEAVQKEKLNDSEFGAAVALSHTLTETTGIAMSPLLGMGALGAWKYWKTEGDLRADLPWYADPWVWGICFAVFLLLKSKDTFGAFIPEMAKKPITVVDDLQEKVSAAIVVLALIPTVVIEDFKDMIPRDNGEPTLAVAPFVIPVLITIVVIAVFLVVWTAFNALSSIKILSPSSIINSIISAVKGTVLIVFASLAALNPWVGLALSVVIIVVCAIIFGWAFRWNVFGTLFVKDFFTAAYNRPLAEGERLKGFSTPSLPDVKPRTYGQIDRKGNELIFSWKPWLIMPRQRVRICLDQVETSARKGILLPAVTVKDAENGRHRSILDFRLRYRSHSEEIQKRLALDSITPSPVLSGFRACWDWLGDCWKKGRSSLANALTTDVT